MLRPSRNVEKDSHPAVFVALGSHANYFYGPEICPNDKTIGHTQAEIMDRTGKAAALIPEMRLLPDRKEVAVKPQAWLDIGSTNIFADVMLDGRLYRGATGMAIEIGHVPIEPDDPCVLVACMAARKRSLLVRLSPANSRNASARDWSHAPSITLGANDAA